MISFFLLATCVGQAAAIGDVSDKEGEFTVEIARGPLNRKDAKHLHLSAHGFVFRTGHEIGNEGLKEIYLKAPAAGSGEINLFIDISDSDRREITVESLFRHIGILRQLRDPKTRVHIYVIEN
jgi:hypothetical protein